MLLSLVYFALRWPLQALAPSGRADLEREVELLVLRHQVKVLSRGVRRPRLRRRDRMLLAAASRVLSRDRWKTFVVTPRTLLRWHRELVHRKWTYRRRGPGRPPIDPETVELIFRMARENQVGLPQDPRRTAEARRPGVRHGHPDHPSPTWSRSCPSPERPLVERVPEVPSPRDPGVRFLHCRDGVAPHLVRLVRDRARISPGPCPRRHGDPGLRLGDPAGPEPRRGGAAPGHPIPDPGPGHQVLRSFR